MPDTLARLVRTDPTDGRVPADILTLFQTERAFLASASALYGKPSISQRLICYDDARSTKKVWSITQTVPTSKQAINREGPAVHIDYATYELRIEHDALEDRFCFIVWNMGDQFELVSEGDWYDLLSSAMAHEPEQFPTRQVAAAYFAEPHDNGFGPRFAKRVMNKPETLVRAALQREWADLLARFNVAYTL